MGSGLENERGLAGGGRVFGQTRAEIRLALRLVEVVEGTHLRAVVRAAANFLRCVQMKLRVARVAVAFADELRCHTALRLHRAAIGRVAAARRFIAGRPDLGETIRRLTAYAEAGAECLYAPGIRTREEITAIVSAVAPRPVNVLVSSDFTTVADLAALGVRRISVGGALARTAWAGFLAAAREIADGGTFTALTRAVPGAELNARFRDDASGHEGMRA